MKNKLAIAALLALACTAASAATEYAPLLRAKKFVDAEKLANARLAQDPANVAAAAAKVDAILGASGVLRVDEAVSIAEQCVAAHPQAAACHLALGQALGAKALNAGILSAMGYVGTIRDAFKKAVELEPGNVRARSALMDYYLMAPSFVGGGKDKAKDLVRSTAVVNGAAGQLMQARLDLGGDQYAKAEAAILALRPGSDDALEDLQRGLLATLGQMHLKEKRYTESERIFKLMQGRFPDSDMGWYGLGRAQHDQGRDREAITAYEHALAIADTASAHYRLAESALAIGDKARAAAEFGKALTVKTAIPPQWREEAQKQVKSLR